MVFGAKVMYLGAMWRWGRVGDILADVLSYRSCLTREERGDCANSCHTPTKYYAAEGKGQRQILRQESITQKLDPVGSTVRYEMVKLCTGSVQDTMRR